MEKIFFNKLANIIRDVVEHWFSYKSYDWMRWKCKFA